MSRWTVGKLRWGIYQDRMTRQWNPSGAAETWIIPLGVTELLVEIQGGLGAIGSPVTIVSSFILPVAPFDTVELWVGCSGTDQSDGSPEVGGFPHRYGGWPDGGNGGDNTTITATDPPFSYGGGGGGSSRIHVNSTLVAVAPGSGGGAWYKSGASWFSVTGGRAGDAYWFGQNGDDGSDSTGGGDAVRGRGATTSAAGAGGTGSTNGAAGSGTQGGNGATYGNAAKRSGGGGGGGGYYGAGGGAFQSTGTKIGAGGGGSMWYDTGLISDIRHDVGGSSSGTTGFVKFTWLVPNVGNVWEGPLEAGSGTPSGPL